MPHHSTKSSAMSSCSSPHSTTSSASLSSVSRSHARTIDCGIKCGIKHVKNHANAIAPPLKWAKHALSVVLSPVISDKRILLEISPASQPSSCQRLLRLGLMVRSQSTLKRNLFCVLHILSWLSHSFNSQWLPRKL